MKKMVSFFFACAVLPLLAVDFDFTANPPVAKGKVPMMKLDASQKIGGSAGKTALHMDGKEKALNITGTGNFTLDKGLTAAFDIVLEKKEGKKNFHMLLMKKREWLIGVEDNRLYINFFDGKKWMPGYYCRANFSQPARWVITISQGLKIKIWRDGKLYHTGTMATWGAQPATGTADVSFGCTWGSWGVQGDLYRLRIADGVLDEAAILEF